MYSPPENLARVERLLEALRDYSGKMTAVGDTALGTKFVENGQFLALAHLIDNDEVAIAELAVVAHMDRRRLMKFLRELEARSVVSLGHHAVDARVRTVALTATGVAMLHATQEKFEAFFAESAPLALEIVALCEQGEPDDTPARITSAPVARGFGLAVMVARTGMDIQSAVRELIGDEWWSHLRGQRVLALSVIARTPTCRPQVLVEELRLTAGGVTQLLDTLARDGLIERVRDIPDDRRGVRIALTADGRGAADAIASAVLTNLSAIGERFRTISQVSVAA